MRLHARRWSDREGGAPIVCIHGAGQHGGIYRDLATRLEGRGATVTAVDLRGHGASGKEPPWGLDAHVADLEETALGVGIDKAVWVGHSFGARVAIALAHQRPDLVEGLVLLDPWLEVSAEHALKRAEVERLDWSFSTVAGAVRALTGPAVPASAQRAIEDFVQNDLVSGPDNLLRFSYSPAAVVVAWSEMVRPVRPLQGTPTLVIRATGPDRIGPGEFDLYRATFGATVDLKSVPNGHNVLWEAPDETAGAIEQFLVSDRMSGGLRQ